jgi:putative SOS response-associated peptidase YedK
MGDRRALHDRMPVILAQDGWAKWLVEAPVTNDELKVLHFSYLKIAVRRPSPALILIRNDSVGG